MQAQKGAHAGYVENFYQPSDDAKAKFKKDHIILFLSPKTENDFWLTAKNAYESIDFKMSVMELVSHDDFHIHLFNRIQHNDLQGVEKHITTATKNSLNETFKFDFGDSVFHTVSPLHVAATFGNPDMMDLLLAKGAKIDSVSNIQRTALFYAVADNDLEKVEFLLGKGADINHKDLSGVSVLFLSVTANLEDMFGYLIEKGADINIVNENHTSLVDECITYKRLTMLKKLIRKGVAITRPGVTYLHSAAYLQGEDIPKVIDILLKACIPLDVRDDQGNTPLLTSLGSRLTKTPLYLIEKGADIRAADHNGATALHFATLSGNIETLQMLIKKGLDINVKDKDGNTPLHYVAKDYVENSGEVAGLLLRLGASKTIKNKNNKTPFDLASANYNVPFETRNLLKP